MKTLSIAAVLSATTLALGGCAALATQPAAPATLAGAWQRDAAASDDFDHKLSALLDALRRQKNQRHASAGNSGTAGGGRRGGARSGRPEDSELNDGDADANGGVPAEDPDKTRSRLADDLRPPGSLLIAVEGATVEITADTEPVRQYFPGQSVSRIDSSGAASVTSGWNRNVFEISARYTDRATRRWRYELEPKSGLLCLGFDATDPEFGRFALVTRYRRAAPQP